MRSGASGFAPAYERRVRPLSKQIPTAKTRSIIWTQQHQYLWTGRIGGKPAGTIERGARYNYIDLLGAEHHGFRTLEAAQDAAEQLAPELAP